MPTYEYRCPNEHTFEVFQKMSDDPVATCPECGREAERILSGGAGFLFKGEGFYITDYRSDEYRKKAAAESGGGGDKSEKAGDGGGKGDAAKTSGSGGSKTSGSKSGSGGADSGSAGPSRKVGDKKDG